MNGIGHFNAADYNILEENSNAIYLFEGKAFDEWVDLDKENFGYQMGCNLDIDNPELRKELLYCNQRLINATGVDGFRFDGVKHVHPKSFIEWLNHLRNHNGRNYMIIGEYWSTQIEALKYFVEIADGEKMLFDYDLHYNLAF